MFDTQHMSSSNVDCMQCFLCTVLVGWCVLFCTDSALWHAGILQWTPAKRSQAVPKTNQGENLQILMLATSCQKPNGSNRECECTIEKAKIVVRRGLMMSPWRPGPGAQVVIMNIILFIIIVIAAGDCENNEYPEGENKSDRSGDEENFSSDEGDSL